MKRCSCILKSLNIHKPFPIFVFKMYVFKGNVFFLHVFKKGYIKKRERLAELQERIKPSEIK